MELSILFAKIIGLYCLVVSISALLNYQRMPALFNELIEQEGVIYLAAIVSLIVGILITTLHPVVAKDWRIIITIFGWGAFMLGIVNLLIPDLAKQIIRAIALNRFLFSLFSLLVLASSLVLLKEGFGIEIQY